MHLSVSHALSYISRIDSFIIFGTVNASGSATLSSSAAATSSSAGMAKAHFGYGELVGAGVALVGAVIGGGLMR